MGKTSEVKTPRAGGADAAPRERTGPNHARTKANIIGVATRESVSLRAGVKATLLDSPSRGMVGGILSIDIVGPKLGAKEAKSVVRVGI
jgi:hypothetical protein